MAADIVLMIQSSNMEGQALRSLRSELRRLTAPGRRMILDLAGVDHIDTRGASMILEIARALQARGGSLKLVGVQRKVSAFFELLRMHRVVEMHNSHNEALTLQAAA
jgi:anti-sigma B factor antagonist